ncbi:tail fiber domain-containing protein [Planctomycetota bacterium]
MKRTVLVSSLVLVLVLVGSAIAGWVTSGNNMYPDVSGNVGIGTGTPECKLVVIASGAASNHEWAPAIYGKNTGVGDGLYGWSQNRHGVYGVTKSIISGHAGVYAWNQGQANVENYGGYFKAEGGKGIGVWGWGKGHDFYAAGTGKDYGSASSIRWKSDIRPIDAPLDKVLRLRGVYFTWDEEHGGEHDLGMIAEEVGEVLPEIVSYEPDGEYTSGMDYSRLTPLLIEAVKALNSETAELKDRLSKLESLRKENTDLHNRIKTLEAMVGQLASKKNSVSEELLE